jgi:HK97 gp10 family phage protein
MSSGLRAAGRHILVEVRGAEELLRRFDALATRGQSRIARAMITAQMKVYRERIKAALPAAAQTPGHGMQRLRRSIGSRQGRAKGKGTYEGKVGVRVGKGKQHALAPHAHLFALGTRQRVTAAGASRGAMPANDFVRRGFYAGRAEAIEAALVAARKILAEPLR